MWAAEVARRASADAKVAVGARWRGGAAEAGGGAVPPGHHRLLRRRHRRHARDGALGLGGRLGGKVANLRAARRARPRRHRGAPYRSLASEWADAWSHHAQGHRRPRPGFCAIEVLTDRHDKVRLLLLRSTLRRRTRPRQRRRVARARPCRLLARGALELMRELRMTPAAVIERLVATLTAPYARARRRGGRGGAEYWEQTAFVLFRNLEPGYDGTIALPKGEKYDPSPAEPLATAPAAVGAPPRRAGGARASLRAALLASNAGLCRPATARSSPRPPRSRRSCAPSARRLRARRPLAELREALVRTAVMRWRARAAAPRRRGGRPSPLLPRPRLPQKGVLLLDCVPALLSTRAAASRSSSAAGRRGRVRPAAPRRCARSATRATLAAPWRYSPTARSRAPAPG